MNVHLVSIEVSIVGATVGIVHTDCLLFWQDLRQMCHHTWLMKGRLSVDKKDISVAKVAMDYLLAYLELLSDSIPVLLGHVLEEDLVATVFIFDHVGTRVHLGAIPHKCAKSLDVDIRNTLGKGQLFGHEHGHADLISRDVGVGGYNTPSTKVDSFTHHFHAEHAFFALKELPDTWLGFVSRLLSH